MNTRREEFVKVLDEHNFTVGNMTLPVAAHLAASLAKEGMQIWNANNEKLFTFNADDFDLEPEDLPLAILQKIWTAFPELSPQHEREKRLKSFARKVEEEI